MMVANCLTHPPHLPLVAPSILAADFSRLGDQCRAVLEQGADLLHLDVMDGHFVPNLTMGPALCRSVRAALPDAVLDVHLMVERPEQFIEPFAEAGANHLTFHIEAVQDPSPVIEAIHDAGCTAGLAINPPTPLAALEPWVDRADLLLVMSVHPGFSGQAFIDSVLVKAKALHRSLRENQRLQIDGGVNAVTAEACREAGCDVLVAASAIFNAPEPGESSMSQALRYKQSIEVLRGAPQVSGSC